jgi:hypothetical protein
MLQGSNVPPLRISFLRPKLRLHNQELSALRITYHTELLLDQDSVRLQNSSVYVRLSMLTND